MTSLVLTVPRSLWMSANRVIPHHGRRQRIIQGLHVLAAAAARQTATSRLPEPCTITWQISYPRGTGPKADPPNAYPTTKAVLDGLVQAHLLSDDHAGVVVAQAFCRGPNTTRKDTHQITVTITPYQE